MHLRSIFKVLPLGEIGGYANSGKIQTMNGIYFLGLPGVLGTIEPANLFHRITN